MTYKEKIEGADYTIQILGKNVLVTPAMEKYAVEKLSKLERFHNHIMDVHVTMDIEHLDHYVAIVVKFDHFKVRAEAHSTDMYASIDQAMHRLQHQFAKWKDRMQDHAKKKLSTVDMEVSLLESLSEELKGFNEEIDLKNKDAKEKPLQIPKVTGKKTIPLKELTVNEAIMKMELSSDYFLVYRSEEDRKLKVMYRRKDGNYGIIQPE